MKQSKQTWKLYWEHNGKFIMKIPANWTFKLDLNSPNGRQRHLFELRNKRIAAFILSISPHSETFQGGIDFRSIPTPQDETKINWTKIEPSNSGDEFAFTIWVGKSQEFNLLATYTTGSQSLKSQLGKNQLARASEVVDSIAIVPEKSRVDVASFGMLNEFMSSMIAAIDLANRAFQNGSNIELVVLLSSKIDSMLRLLLVLNSQMESKSLTFDRELLSQKDSEKGILEREIYRKAKAKGLIDAGTFDLLNRTYDLRNKIVHRYVISRITSSEIVSTVGHLLKIESILSPLVIEVERLQKLAQTGFYGTPFPVPAYMEQYSLNLIRERIKDKHSIKRLNQTITIGHKKKISNPKVSQNA